MSQTFLLVDFHRIISESLHALIDNHFSAVKIMKATSGTEALEIAKNHEPDIVITELSKLQLEGVFLLRGLRDYCPNTKILVLSAVDYGKTVKEALQAGADGYVVKNEGFNEVVQAIRSIMDGRRYISQQIREHRKYIWRTTGELQYETSELTQREREVLALIAGGKTTSEIADSFRISEKTIYSHRSSLMQKLGVSSVAELTKYALREGITTL